MRSYIGSKTSDLPLEHQGDGKDLPSLSAEDAERNRKAREQREREHREEQRQRLQETSAAIEERAREDAELAARRSASPMYRDV